MSAAIWISGQQGSRRLALDSGDDRTTAARVQRAAAASSPSAEFPVTGAARAGVLWAGRTTLRRLSLDRRLAPDTEIARRVLDGERLELGAARPDGQRVWAVLAGEDGKSRLTAFDATLRERWSADLTGGVEALEYAGRPQQPDGTTRPAGANPHTDRALMVWALEAGRVVGYDRKGRVSREWPVSDAQALTQPSPDRLWVGDVGGVTAFDARGERVTRVESAAGVQALEADSRNGAWAVLGDGSLVHLDSNLAERQRLVPGYQGITDTITTARADPRTGALWFATDRGLYRATRDGAIERETALDGGLGVVTGLTLLADTFRPRLRITAPGANAVVATEAPSIALEWRDAGTGVRPESPSFTLNGKAVEVDCPSVDSSRVECTLPAQADGEYALAARVTDGADLESKPATAAFTLDTQAPKITLDAGVPGAVTNADSIAVTGRLSETGSLRVDGRMASVGIDGGFSVRVSLDSDGARSIRIVAEDRAGNTRERSITVTRDTAVPLGVDAEQVTTTIDDADGTVVVAGNTGAAESGATVVVTNVDTDETSRVTVNSAGAFRTIVSGDNGDTFALQVEDKAGNTSDKSGVVAGLDVPPDPAAVAPEPPATGTPPLSDRADFLYSGNDPIQQGVAEATIEPERVAVVRGEVHDRAGNPLPGVEVTILGHPEYGRTASRADGRFDLAVNGGGVITVEYNKDGYLPVQRTVKPQWEDTAHAEPVVMTPLSDKVSTVDLTDTSEPFQVARGPGQTDDAGERQATLLFPVGVSAEITSPGGTKKQLSQLDVRATEYTVGDTGPEAMPGELPPASAYTYAVELSVDQALEQGVKVEGKDVTFSEPVSFYVDNFLDFPTGEAVPVGYYNNDTAAWVPSDNGRIIEIVGQQNGKAILDVTGDGDPATDAELAEVNLTDDERAQLAELYAPGDSLWRFTTTHLSTWDCNWPYGPPEDAEKPDVPPPETPEENDTDEENECDGCIISPQAQSLGESIPVAGTPFALHYQSNRAEGAAVNSVTIPLTDGDVPDSLQSVELTIDIAGRRIRKSFSPGRTSYQFIWNGLDQFDQPRYGRATAQIRLAYRYECVYRPGNNGFGSFGGQAEALGTRSRCQGFELARKSTFTLDSPIPSQPSAGNWSLSSEHVLEEDGTLLLGSGEKRTIATIATINTVAETRGERFSGFARGIVVTPDRNYYIADIQNNKVRRVTPDGTIDTVAGTAYVRSFGGPRFSGDNGPAIEAELARPDDISVRSDGTLYIADSLNNRIRRVTPDGTIDTVAGTGASGFGGDGGPATEATLFNPSGLAITPDGSLYVAESGNDRVRRVAPDGTIDTVAGNGSEGFSGDNGPAIEAALNRPEDVAVRSDGTIYIADRGNQRIRRVTPDGTIDTVAGTGSFGFDGDGGPATDAKLSSPTGIATDPNGGLLIADSSNNRIRRVAPDGTIDTVAGNGDSKLTCTGAPLTCRGDGEAATETAIGLIHDIALGPNGGVYILETFRNNIRRVRPGAIASTGTIASKDGIHRYGFDGNGRIRRTEDTRTGETIYTFERNDNGRLIRVLDGDGNSTTIERDADGTARAIVAPDGQRTQLVVNGQGHLTGVTDPRGQGWSMAYTNDGLMTRYTDRTGATNRFRYTADGRLAEDNGPEGSGWTLARTDRDNGYAVTMTSGAGRAAVFALERPESGTRVYTNTAPDGTVTKRTHTDTGDTTIERPSGTTISRSEGPDPRFGVGAPVVEQATIETPSGLARTVERERTADVAEGAPLTEPDGLTRSVTVNGRTAQSVFDGASNTWTTTTPEDRRTTTKIDGQGRATRSQLGPFAATERSYDARGRLTTLARTANGQTRTTQYAYATSGADAGYLASVTGPTGRTVTFERDAMGRVTQQTRPDGRAIGFDYDPEGRLTAVDPPGRPKHVLTYDANGSRTDYAPPQVDGSAAVTRYAFNADEQLSSIERPDGKMVNVTYNSAGKRSQVTAPVGTWAYTYNSTSGKASNLTAPGGQSLSFTRDGPLLTQSQWSGPVNGTVARTYDDSFRLTQQTVGGQSIALAYDADSLLTQAGALSLTRAGDHPGVTATSLDGITTSRTYNGFGELGGRTAQAGADTVYDAAYTRDSAGRITQAERDTDGYTTTYKYQYDDVGRLTEVSADGTLIHLYDYGPTGNRRRHTGPNGTTTAEYDARDRLTRYGDATYTYNAAGDLTARTAPDGRTTYDYDVLGNLRGVDLADGTAVDYVIDGRNRRVGKKVDGTLEKGWLYQDQLNPVAQTDGAGNVTHRFVYADKDNVPAYMIKDGTRYRFITDPRGSVRLVVNADTGAIAQRLDYSPFGRVTTDTNPGFQPFGFAGGLYDPDTGLVRFGARDYDPETGRWTAKDPIGFAGGSTNLYGYAINDPVNFVDPDGEIAVTTAIAIGAIATGAVSGAIAEGTGGNFFSGAVTGAAGFVGGAVFAIAVAPGIALTSATFVPTAAVGLGSTLAGTIGSVGTSLGLKAISVAGIISSAEGATAGRQCR